MIENRDQFQTTRCRNVSESPMRGGRTWFDGIFVEIGNTDLLQNIFIDTEVPSVTLRVAGKNDVSSIRHDLRESQRIHGVLTAHQFTQHVHRRSGDTFMSQTIIPSVMIPLPPLLNATLLPNACSFTSD